MRKRKILAIRGTLVTCEEGLLGIYFIHFIYVTNDAESTFCQTCIKYRTEVYCCLTKKCELKTQNTKRHKTQDTKHLHGVDKSVGITYRNIHCKFAKSRK